ncbi:MAG: hypothetical protein KY466_04580 [Gemmatimonadetes bacterium]|nr:hypothetical protein [Gemmatimonadota bacterium]
MRVRALLFLLLTALSAPGVAAQHVAADRSIAASLLTALQLPTSSPFRWIDDWPPRPAFRVDLQYSRLVAGDRASPLIIAGARSDRISRDSVGWSAGVTAFRVAIGTGSDARRRPLAMEVQLGGRTLDYLESPFRPDLGIDMLVGWSSLEGDADGSLAFRLPAEWVRPLRDGRLTLAFAPTVAWGDMKIRGCHDDGPNDNCGDLGLQLEFGRTRFILAGGASVGFAPTGLVVSVGVQRFLAAGQEPRLALGVAWIR